MSSCIARRKERKYYIADDEEIDESDNSNFTAVPVDEDDTRRWYIVLPSDKAVSIIKNWEEKDPEEEVTEEMEKAYFSGVLYNEMPKHEPCRDVLPMNNG